MSNINIYPFLYVVRGYPTVEISNDQEFLDVINSMNRAGKNKFIRITSEFLKNLVIKDGKLTRKDLYATICKRGKSNRSSEFYIFMGYDIEFAKQRISELQISSTNKVKTYQNNYDISFIMKKHNVSLEEATLIREARLKSTPLPSTIDYWINRGFSETESKEKVKEHNSFAFSKLQEKDVIDPTRKIGRCPTQLEYYLKRGMSQEDAQIALSDRQTTFNLDICIEKYGIEEGTKIWQARQDKWIKTLDDKSEEEKVATNQKRGIDKNGNPHFGRNPTKIKSTLGRDCMLYYLMLTDIDTGENRWKIGLTFQSIKQRFSKLTPSRRIKYKILYSIIDKVDSVFYTEQRILHEFNEWRTMIDKNGFKTTECFSKDIFGSEKSFMSYFNACKLSQQFSSIRSDESLSSPQSS